ncbi:hypothetical protein K1T71_013132 [Dendrolimus kikuchii]|uniref:Uncharacterized protein n=1 Tax=Dendrolimus kikuchii TaxID=765133 RepID=A0ACC1CJB2_9NEOP|nr:hypothetical protein K1T71_014855 [Dendrolimus kikuchii]KAJ0171582.1 hypothetical protein K1T71_013132 [Dendrolimus kikuchii]
MEQQNISTSDSDTPTPSYVSKRIKQRSEHVSKSDFNNFRKEMKEFMSSLFSSQEKELQSISTTQKDIQKSNQTIENSIALLSSQQEEFKKKINSLEQQTIEDRKYISILEEKMEEMQRAHRKCNFELKNVPKQNTETKKELLEMITTLSTNIGGSLSKTDIKDIYRVRTKNDNLKNAPIIVETSSVMLKMEFLKNCKLYNMKNKAKLRAQQLGLRTNENNPVFVSEQLTAKGSRLHFLARDLVKSKEYKYCWTAFGKVYIRKDENSPIIWIHSEAQVQQFIQK